MVEFATEPGIYFDISDAGPALRIPEVRADPRALLYRFAAKRITSAQLSRFHMATYDPTCSALYSNLMECGIETLPWPHTAMAEPRNRVGKRPIVVSVLGHQREDKGYQHMPNVAEGLLAANQNIQILLHNAAPDGLHETQDALRQMARNDSRIIVDERIADKRIWLELLERSDIIICPYNIMRYATSHSTVVSEAIAHGIPLVVPANTVLARVISEYGNPGTLFRSTLPLRFKKPHRRLSINSMGLPSAR